MFTNVYWCFFTYVYACLLCLPMFTYFHKCFPLFTRFYLCVLVLTTAYSFIPMFTTVYSGMLTHVYSCWHNMVIPCYLWLQMLTYVYSLNLFTFVYPCLLVFTSVYLCLPLFIFVYLCLLVLTYVCRCLLLQVYICWHMFTYVSSIYPFFVLT